jgi:hypothetical protein
MAQKRIDYYGQFTPTGVDTSQAKRLQALSGLAEQVGDIAFEVGAKIQTKRGQEAGLAAGAEAADKGEMIETQKGFLSQISIFDQAYNNAMSKAYVAGVDNDARENVNRLLTDNPDDIDAFDEAVNAYRNGVTQNIAEEFRPLISQSMDQMITSARSQVHQSQTAKNLKNADDTLIRSGQTATEAALKAARIGDDESAMIGRMNAFSTFDARVEAGTITPAAAETAKQNLIVATEGEKARGGLQALIKNRGAYAAVEFINAVADTPVSNFTLNQQEELANVLRADLNEYISLTNIQEKQSEDALKARQGENFTSLYVGLINGETDVGDITRTAMAGNLTQSQLTTLTNVMNTRGQGIDDFNLIYDVQTQMYENPEAARNLIIANTGTRLTASRAQSLLSTLGEEPILNTPKATRYRKYVSTNVGIVDPITGKFTGAGTKERAADLMLAFDEKVLTGEDPAAVAEQLLNINDIPPDFTTEADIDKAFERLEKQVTTMDKSEYDTRAAELQQYRTRIRNFQNMMTDIKRGQ